MIMEVKPVNAQRGGIEKDLKTLTAFRNKGGYSRAIFLIYGVSNSNFNKIKSTSKFFAEMDENGMIDLNLIELWHHANPGEEAYQLDW